MYCTPCLNSLTLPTHLNPFYFDYAFQLFFESSDLMLLFQHCKKSLYYIWFLIQTLSSLFSPGLSLTPSIQVVLELPYLKSHLKSHSSISNPLAYSIPPGHMGGLIITEFKVKLNQFTWEIRIRKQKDWLSLFFYITTVPFDINIVRYRKAYYKFSTHSKTSLIYQSHPIQHISFPSGSMWPGHLMIIINVLFLAVLFIFYSDCSELRSNTQHEVALLTNNKADLWRQKSLSLLQDSLR